MGCHSSICGERAISPRVDVDQDEMSLRQQRRNGRLLQERVDSYDGEHYLEQHLLAQEMFKEAGVKFRRVSLVCG
jgi:hypothetical protein